MTEATNHWKLGLFVVLGLGLGAAALIFVGAIGFRDDVTPFHAYFDESVNGLEPGAPVKLRGVAVGEVASIAIAPDQRHVLATFEIPTAIVERLGWLPASAEAKRATPEIPPDLRAQIDTRGVTGVKHVQLDYFDPRSYPAAELPFSTPPGTIPVTASTMKRLEDSVLRFVEDFPAVSGRAVAVLDQMRELLAELHEHELPERASAAFEKLDTTLGTLDRKLGDLPVAELSEAGRAATARLDETLVDMQAVLARMDGEEGVLASVQRTSDSIGDMAGQADGVGYELAQTLRDFGELMSELRSFVDALERDPDMLLKGRAELSR